MAKSGGKAGGNPFSPPVMQLDTGSAIAFIGHPVDAMLVHFPIALSILVLVAASLVGIGEIMLVPGIRLRSASWSHAVAAPTFLAVVGRTGA